MAQIFKSFDPFISEIQMPSINDSAKKSTNPEEQQYLNLIDYLLKNCPPRKNRTDVRALQDFGATMTFSLLNDTIPLLTTKKMGIVTILKEMLWFLKGDTNGNHLLEQNVKIWAGNGSREFLDSRGLNHYEENDLGPIYGFQWRFFGAEYNGCNADYTGKGVDQIARVIDTIKKDPSDRRLIVSAWNAADLDKMALPPCPVLFQFHVEDEFLDCQLYQRSCDMGLGVPFDIAGYSILTHMIARLTGLKARKFIHVLGNYHVYENHTEQLKEQISRSPYQFPQLNIKDRGQKTVEDFVFEDFEVVNYEHHPFLKMAMAL